MKSLVRTALILAVGILVTPVRPALAAPPIQERISDPVSFVLPGSDFCGFDVQVDAEQKFKVITFTGQRGTWWTTLTAGKLKAVLTNLDTEESIEISVPGPGFIDVDGNLMVGTGPWLIFVPGQVLYLIGHITFEPGPFGVQAASVRGRSIDLCDVLA
jgi:hypothetical protein